MNHIKRLNKHISIRKRWLVIAVFVIMTAIAFILFDYLSYLDGNRSHFFGTLDTYNQNQMLKFDSLNLKVVKVSLKQYPKPKSPTRLSCKGLSDVTPDSFSLPGVNSDLLGIGSPYDICSNSLNDYNDASKYVKTNNGLIVSFKYSNVSAKPLNLARFNVRLVANTHFTESPNPIIGGDITSCKGMPRTLLIKGSTESSCITKDINKNYHGPLILSVTKDGKEKDISLQLN